MEENIQYQVKNLFYAYLCKCENGGLKGLISPKLLHPVIVYCEDCSLGIYTHITTNTTYPIFTNANPGDIGIYKPYPFYTKFFKYFNQKPNKEEHLIDKHKLIELEKSLKKQYTTSINNQK